MDLNPDQAVRASRLPLTAEALADLVGGRAKLTALAVTGSSPSTNSELLVALEADPAAWPHLSAYVADHQTAGRGRAGRDWHTPAGAALTVSFVLRPRLPEHAWGLVPLAVGLAVVRMLRASDVDASLKWPNDVIVPSNGHELPGWGQWRKVAGVLCERRGDAVVSGVGLNVSQDAAELPVPHATSLALLGAHVLDRYALLDALSNEVARAISGVENHADDLLAAVTAATATLGTAVVAELPGQPPVTGEAVRIGPGGELIVRQGSGEEVTITAGDVRLRSHL